MPSYGNVPDEDVSALRAGAAAAARVVDRLGDVPGEWRDIAYEMVLEGIVRDWVDNGTTDLDEGDEQDLADLVRVAADVAREQYGPRRDVAFRVLCRGAMADWVANWNADEE